MRVAILSAVKLMAGADAAPRGFMRIAGRSVIQRQVAFALEAGCENIACLANDVSPELIAVQQQAEKAGAKFRIVHETRNLSGLVNASDEVLIIEDGLVFDRDLAMPPILNGKHIQTLPADTGVAAGFERLDRERAWAGIALVSGALVEKLFDLPPDIDAQSCLMRLALQNGAQCNALPVSVSPGEDWGIANDAEGAVQIETRWLGRNAAKASYFSPLNAAADRVAIAAIQRYQEPEKTSKIMECLALTGFLLGGLLGGALGFYDYLIAALFALLLAIFCAKIWFSLNRLLSSPDSPHQYHQWRSNAYLLAFDVMVSMLLVLSAPLRDRWESGFSALILFGMVRLVGRFNSWPGAEVLFTAGQKKIMLGMTLTDRLVISVVIAGGFAAGQILIFAQLYALILLAAIMAKSYQVKLTRA